MAAGTPRPSSLAGQLHVRRLAAVPIVGRAALPRSGGPAPCRRSLPQPRGGAGLACSTAGVKARWQWGYGGGGGRGDITRPLPAVSRPAPESRPLQPGGRAAEERMTRARWARRRLGCAGLEVRGAADQALVGLRAALAAHPGGRRLHGRGVRRPPGLQRSGFRLRRSNDSPPWRHLPIYLLSSRWHLLPPPPRLPPFSDFS